MKTTDRIQSIERAISILKLFSPEKPELKLTEISSSLGLNKSTVHTILSTLKYHGLIEQNENTQKYKLGIFILELGNIMLESIEENITEIGHPILEELSRELDETVHLVYLDGREIVYLDKVSSLQSIRIHTNIGSRLFAHATGLGKVILANLDESEIKRILPTKLEKLTENTITKRSELLKELNIIKEKGYSIDNGENEVGLRCIAAPIFNNTGKVKYALSVSGPTFRIADDKIEIIAKRVQHFANLFSKKLGYRKK